MTETQKQDFVEKETNSRPEREREEENDLNFQITGRHSDCESINVWISELRDRTFSRGFIENEFDVLYSKRCVIVISILCVIICKTFNEWVGYTFYIMYVILK